MASTSKCKRVLHDVRAALRTDLDASNIVPFTVYESLSFLQASVCGVFSGSGSRHACLAQAPPRADVVAAPSRNKNAA